MNQAETCQIDEGRKLSNLTCLQPGARLRFAKKDKNGNPDSKLSWDLQDGIEHGSFIFWAWDGTEPVGTKLLADGTYSYDFTSECGCNQVLPSIKN